MNKEILFEYIKCGNLSAFEALFRQYYPSMCVIAGKLVANREVAEDIVQDVFIRLWEKKAEYDKIPDFRTFLYVAVRNLCYNYLRDKKKTIDFSQIELPDKQLSFQEQLIQEETYRLISNAIAELPVQSGKIMRLALEGKQNKEISEILGIAVTTVKTLKYNALKMLKNSLKGYFPVLLYILFRKK